MGALKITSTLSRLRNGLIVSCQPRVKSALDQPGFVAALAVAAGEQGSVGVRIRGVRDIRAVRRAVHIPVIGIEKINDPEFEVYITPTFESVQRVHRAGAQIIAMDATERPRPHHQPLSDIIKSVKADFDVLFMADVATLRQGVEAANMGFDMVATTLYGYTKETKHRKGPAFELARKLVREVGIPVILEGRVHKPEHVRKAFDLGVYAVVVGTAITDFEWLARRFVEACPNARKKNAASCSSQSAPRRRAAAESRKRKMST